jgi:hypothetical protein
LTDRSLKGKNCSRKRLQIGYGGQQPSPDSRPLTHGKKIQQLGENGFSGIHESVLLSLTEEGAFHFYRSDFKSLNVSIK